MLTPQQISERIKNVALEIVPNSVYLRATDQEANISVDLIDLADKVFVLYNNKPTVSASINQESGLIIENIPVEISILCLADMDDDDQDMDVLTDPLYQYAIRMFDRLSLEEVLANYVEGYDIALGDDSTKLYDKIMTGVILSFDIISQRGYTYPCIPAVPPNTNQPQPPPNAGVNPNQPQPPVYPPNPNQPQPPPNAGVNPNQPQPPVYPPNPNQPQPPPHLGPNPNQPQPIPVPPATESITYAFADEQGFANLVFPAGLGRPWSHLIGFWTQLNIRPATGGNFDILSKDLVSDFPITGLLVKIKATIFIQNLGDMVGNYYVQLCDGTTPIASVRVNATQSPQKDTHLVVETDYTVFGSNVLGVNILTTDRAEVGQGSWNIDDLIVTRIPTAPIVRPSLEFRWGGVDRELREWVEQGLGVAWVLLPDVVDSYRYISDGTSSNKLSRLATWQEPQDLTVFRLQGQYRPSIATDLGDLVAELYVDGVLLDSKDMVAYIGTGQPSWTINFDPQTLINSGTPFVDFRIRDNVSRAGLIVDLNTIVIEIA